MKKNLLLAALMAIASVFSVSAEVLTPYEEQFENTIRPKGWLRGGAYSYSQGTFTPHETGGHSGGYLSVNQYYNTYSTYYKNYSYNDLLVTPKVEGEVSMWVRKNGSEPTLTVYTIEDVNNIPSSADKLTRLADTSSNIVEGMTIDDWTKVTLSGVPAGTNLGIRLNNLDIDEFTATSADVLYRPSLIVNVEKSSSNTTLEADADNKVTFSFKVSIENNGDIDFPASDEGFKIELVNANLDNKLFGTDYITEAIPCGTKVEKEIQMTGVAEVAPNSSSNNYKVIITHALTNSIETSLGWYTVIPYLPVTKFMFFENNDANNSTYNDVNIKGKIVIGAGAAATTSRTLWMWNSGTAPMNVTAVTVSDGFTTDAEPFTLAKGEKKSVTISLAGEPGLKTGTITFTEATLGDVKYDITGLVTKEGDYAQDFEGEGSPEGMVIPNSWNIKAASDVLKTLAGEKYIENTSSSSLSRIVTPLITFGEGEKIHFMASKTDNTSSKLYVYTSTDRVNWTRVKAIGTSTYGDFDELYGEDKPTGSGYGTYEFCLFSADVPAGDIYVAFEAGGVRLDNIHGGKLKDVSHDLYVVEVGLPDVAAVNTRYISTIKLRNLLEKAEKDYAILLEVNGEEVARATETPELVKGEDVTFDLRYTPHTAGDFTGKFVFVAGDDRMELNSFDFTVGEEKAEAVYQVGEVKITSTEPLNTYYNTQGQVIYRADQLGMEKGVKLTGFSFNGYCTREMVKNVKVWIENTDDEAYDRSNVQAASTDNMTLVYDGQYTFTVCGNSYDKVYEPVFVIPFNEPFSYDGRSIRIAIEQLDAVEGFDYTNVFVTIDNSVYDYWNDIYDNRVITNQKEYAEDLADEPSWVVYKAGYPVTYFNVVKDIVVAKGNVTDDLGAPVENALVKFTSDDILYSSTTDATGAYSMNIININLTYNLTAEAEGYDSFSKEAVTFTAAEPEAVNDIELKWTDRTATLSGVVTSSLDNGAPLAGVTVALTSGENTVSATTDESGAYTLTVPEFTAEYTLTASIADETLATETYKFASKAETKDIVVAWSSLSSIIGDADTKVTVNGNVITVAAPAGTLVAVYNMAGMQVGSALSDGSAVSFGPLASGIYVAAGHKVVIR